MPTRRTLIDDTYLDLDRRFLVALAHAEYASAEYRRIERLQGILCSLWYSRCLLSDYSLLRTHEECTRRKCSH